MYSPYRATSRSGRKSSSPRRRNKIDRSRNGSACGPATPFGQSEPLFYLFSPSLVGVKKTGDRRQDVWILQKKRDHGGVRWSDVLKLRENMEDGVLICLKRECAADETVSLLGITQRGDTGERRGLAFRCETRSRGSMADLSMGRWNGCDQV